MIWGFNLRNFGLSFLAYQNNFVGSVFYYEVSVTNTYSSGIHNSWCRMIYMFKTQQKTHPYSA